MRSDYLLDTHTMLWFLGGDNKLSEKAKKAIIGSKHKCYVSMASLWEIAIKLKIRRINLDFELHDFSKYLPENNIEIIPIAFEHITQILKLEEYHKDPFDKIILAQAVVEGLTIISKDENFSKYKKVKLLW